MLLQDMTHEKRIGVALSQNTATTMTITIHTNPMALAHNYAPCTLPTAIALHVLQALAQAHPSRMTTAPGARSQGQNCSWTRLELIPLLLPRTSPGFRLDLTTRTLGQLLAPRPRGITTDPSPSLQRARARPERLAPVRVHAQVGRGYTQST